MMKHEIHKFIGSKSSKNIFKYNFNSLHNEQFSKQINIFTFWEPTNSMPAYIKLCIKTWEKHLGKEFNIILLDYGNLEQYLRKKYLKYILSKFSLPKQADAIRCAILNKYGGIWLDADTIILNSNFKNNLKYNADLVLFSHHIGFIYSKKQSIIIKKWYKKIKKRIFRYIIFYPIFKFSFHLRKYFEKWDYLSNGILNNLLNNASPKDFYEIKKESIVFPENNPKLNTFYDFNNYVSNYINLYFNEKFKYSKIKAIINNNSCGLICLHNSWTPEYFKKMSTKEFISSNTTLARILNKILLN